MKIYLVGGAIRDKLAGLPVTDRDWLVVGSTPEEMLALGYGPVGNDFPVFLHPQSHDEYALARTERKTAPGYRGFVFSTAPDVTLEQDLARRDITINAIAEDEYGNIIDPFDGRKDLAAGILRHISPAFSEDPLRVLRVARFAARFNFSVAEETMLLMQQLSGSGELNTLAPERIWAELEKALQSDRPTRFFEVLRDCNALKHLLPEVDRLFGVPQPARHHPEIDTGLHTMMVLEQATRLSTDTTVRFAALVHDLGKGTTPATVLPSHHGHEERGAKLVQSVCQRLRIPNRYRDLAVIVARYHFICHTIMELREDTVLNKLEAMDAFRQPQRFEHFLIACEADARGRTGYENTDYPQANQFRQYFAAANHIDTTTIPMDNMQGIDIAKAIHQLRINAIINSRSTPSFAG
jgi:tRNA nucleotidyltransferase (CCA-adding enzyme)